MTTGSNERKLARHVREIINATNVVMVFVGVTAGYSLSVLTTDTVSLPVVGPAPSLLVGGIGLAASAVVYRRVGCCGSCGSRTFGMSGDCGCDDGCEDSCSVDP